VKTWSNSTPTAKTAAPGTRPRGSLSPCGNHHDTTHHSAKGTNVYSVSATTAPMTMRLVHASIAPPKTTAHVTTATNTSVARVGWRKRLGWTRHTNVCTIRNTFTKERAETNKA